MRKILFFAAVVFAAGCKAPAVVTTNALTFITVGDLDMLNGPLATSMQAKYLSAHFSKRAHHVVTQFNREKLIKILQDSTKQQYVDFFIGMYPSNYPEADKQKKLAIILEIIPATSSDSTKPISRKYYTGHICPPPNNSCKLQ